MAIPKSEKIWFNGKMVPWDKAQIHCMSHVIHYGSSVFEGIRCYKTQKGSAIFRLQDHMRRLVDSSKIHNMVPKYSQKQLEKVAISTVKVNKLAGCYIRPIIFRGYGELGVNPLTCPINTAIAVWKWGKYLGEDGFKKGINVKVSSWTRIAPNTLPAMAKAGGNYMSSQLIKLEALTDGYDEGIALDVNGYVSEGSGENIFLIRNNIIYTPPFATSILNGITRASVVTIAKQLGYEVCEMTIPREMLYVADEIFFTGTAAEVTPINSVDKKVVGKGGRGPVTERIQKHFMEIVEGKREDTHSWLTYI